MRFVAEAVGARRAFQADGAHVAVGESRDPRVFLTESDAARQQHDRRGELHPAEPQAQAVGGRGPGRQIEVGGGVHVANYRPISCETEGIARVFNVILFEPEIPPNTGNAIRLCANTGAALHLVAPLGFRMDDADLRRAGLAAVAHGLDTAVLYRRPNIEAADRIVEEIRSVKMGQLVAAGSSAPFKLAQALQDGKHVGMLIDQHFTKGVDVTFFGRTAKLVAGAGAVRHAQKAMFQIGNFLIVLALVLAAIMVGFRVYHDVVLSDTWGAADALRILQFVLVLLVASIPVAMPAVFSVTMALGALALSKEKAIVSRLEAALPHATPEMAKALRALIRFYQTGEEADREAWEIAERAVRTAAEELEDVVQRCLGLTLVEAEDQASPDEEATQGHDEGGDAEVGDDEAPAQADERPEDDPDGEASLAFQKVADFRRPTWPDGDHPQQFHLDLSVTDIDRAERDRRANRPAGDRLLPPRRCCPLLPFDDGPRCSSSRLGCSALLARRIFERASTADRNCRSVGFGDRNGAY